MGHFSESTACSRLSQVFADGLSRRGIVRLTEWTLTVDVLEPGWNHGFRPMVDLFATYFNHRLPIMSLQFGTTEVGSVCFDGSLVKPVRLCLSPIRHSGKGDSKARIEAARLILLPLVASSDMVPRSDVSVARPAIASSLGSAVSVATKVGRPAR